MPPVSFRAVRMALYDLRQFAMNISYPKTIIRLVSGMYLSWLPQQTHEYFQDEPNNTFAQFSSLNNQKYQLHKKGKLSEESFLFGSQLCKTPCNIREMSSYTVLTYLVVLMSDTFDYFKFSQALF